MFHRQGEHSNVFSEANKNFSRRQANQNIAIAVVLRGLDT